MKAGAPGGGVVLSTSEVTIGYNPDVLKEAGLEEPTADWTWEDFERWERSSKTQGCQMRSALIRQ